VNNIAKPAEREGGHLTSIKKRDKNGSRNSPLWIEKIDVKSQGRKGISDGQKSEMEGNSGANVYAGKIHLSE